MFSTRVIKPELLDSSSPDEARANLADLVRINRSFGGHSVIRDMLARVVQENDRFSLLDIGAASGDAARMIARLYPSASITSLDLHPVNLAAAPHPKLIADAFHLPFGPESFDFVLSSLFLHHFPNTQVIALLEGFYRLARRALLVSDLERHIVPYCFLPATKLVFGWKPITLHDGPISVRASFRRNELLNLAEKAGIQGADVQVHRPAFRLSLIAAKNQRSKSISPQRR